MMMQPGKQSETLTVKRSRETIMTIQQKYKYNPQDYEEVLGQYMTEFYRAYEEKDTMRMRIYMEPLFSETKYAMKEGHISAAMRDEMLKYFWGLCE